ncbi:MAG TPA: HEPN domain-containing protein [Candidatus Tectomicrobia bacterium]|nr:HEPN domain-containing protein [Candidatus Tectomicrobia bacterium]
MARARAALDKARSQLHRVQTASFEPQDPEEAVLFAFYAYENAVVALAEAKGIPWTKNHFDKARLASKLAREGIVTTDVGDQLRFLNEARKDVSYGEPGPDLSSIDLEDLSAGLEAFLDEVDRVVGDAEAG